MQLLSIVSWGGILAMDNAKHTAYRKNHEVYLHLVQTNADKILSALVYDVNKLPMQAWAGRSAYVQCHQVDTQRAVLSEESQLVLSVQSLCKADQSISFAVHNAWDGSAQTKY